MNERLKIVIPMAGFGTRLRPHTWSRPKQLITIGGQTVLDHVLSMFSTLPDPENVEYIFIIGYLGEKIKDYMQANHPELRVQYVVQEEMRGQSHAIYLAREYLHGPMLMVFADTLIETDLSFLADEQADAVAWVKAVPDPRRFGVAKLGQNGLVERIIEKPRDLSNNLAVVGFYYFRDAHALVQAIEAQMAQERQLQGEYYLADAINILLENGATMRTQRVDIWLDAGTVEAVLETNRYLLGHGRDNSDQVSAREGVLIVPPVFIHPEAHVEASVIGPYVSLGAGCEVRHCVLEDTIVERAARISGLSLTHSLIGENAVVEGGSRSVNIGDHSVVNI
ncbi:MAG: nucleotidyltransferase [Anaerolineae bacterium]|nr:MAG: nucleotidyltransferase [Anaerolineae bacterium]